MVKNETMNNNGSNITESTQAENYRVRYFHVFTKETYTVYQIKY